MFFKPPPPIDHRGIFQSAVNQAIRNALEGFRSTDWPLYTAVADDLESFARLVRASILKPPH